MPPAPRINTRGSLLDDIAKGFALKKVDPNDIAAHEEEETGLAGALSAALMKVRHDAGSEDENEEWDDDDWGE